MATKNDPGEFDCYEAAEPDEPLFVLLARDDRAADLVDEWANKRELDIGFQRRPESDRAKVAEARQCAQAMRAWRAARRSGKP